jgi:LCP family protein required for cell wall assembly
MRGMQRSSAIAIGLAVVILGGAIGFFLFASREQPPLASSRSPGASGSARPSGSGALNPELLDRRWTVLYVGTDLNEGREANGDVPNTDALMLVSLSPDQSELTLVSLPRDTVDVPTPDGGTWERKINGLYAERGMAELVAAMETLLGVTIDAHVLLDMDDFSGLVDAAGGITVSPDSPLVDPIVDLDLPAGDAELNGPMTLGYVRTRIDQDYGRMGRQQEVVVALLQRLVDPEADIDLEQLVTSLESLETDLPLEDLPTLAELARRATEAHVRTLVVDPPLITFEGDRGDGRGYVLEPDVEAIRGAVQTLIGD